VNGDFSTGDATGWMSERTNGAEGIIQPYNDIDYGAWLGRYDENQDRLSQLVSVCPGDGETQISLSFWWWMNSAEAEAADESDSLYVRLRSPNGELLRTILVLTNLSQREQWTQAVFDLSAYAGQTFWVSFEAANNAEHPTHFWIDNVSLTVGR
jgi:kumamolisin